MSMTNATTIEFLMRDRIAQRLHEAEQDHLADLARDVPTAPRRVKPLVAMPMAWARLVTNLF